MVKADVTRSVPTTLSVQRGRHNLWSLKKQLKCHFKTSLGWRDIPISVPKSHSLLGFSNADLSPFPLPFLSHLTRWPFLLPNHGKQKVKTRVHVKLSVSSTYSRMKLFQARIFPRCGLVDVVNEEAVIINRHTFTYMHAKLVSSFFINHCQNAMILQWHKTCLLIEAVNINLLHKFFRPRVSHSVHNFHRARRQLMVW